jgi:hypothetical protein
MAAEANLTRRVRRWLDEQPETWSMKVAGGPLQRRGIPDIVGCRRGRFFAIELKAPGGRATPSQRAEMQALEAAGARVLLASTLAEVQAFFAAGA